MTIAKVFALRNELKKCENKRCTKNRYHTSIYCSKCLRRGLKYGDPKAKPLTKRELASWLELAQTFLTRNAESEQVQAATAELRKYIYYGVYSELVMKEIRRLRVAQVDAGKILEKLLAVELLQEWDPRSFSDGSALFSSARCLLSAARKSPYLTTKNVRRYRIPTATASKEIGTWIRSSALGTFLRNAARTILREMDETRAIESRLTKPFIEDEPKPLEVNQPPPPPKPSPITTTRPPPVPVQRGSRVYEPVAPTLPGHWPGTARRIDN